MYVGMGYPGNKPNTNCLNLQYQKILALGHRTSPRKLGLVLRPRANIFLYCPLRQLVLGNYFRISLEP